MDLDATQAKFSARIHGGSGVLEALILIFAEIILACLAPLLSLLGGLLALLLEAVLWLGALLFAGGSAAGRRSRRFPRPSRRKVHIIAGGLAGIGVLGVLASFVLFQPILRTLIATAADRAGMEIRYEAASGKLLFGQVELSGLSLTREAGTGLSFDLAVGRAEADVDLWSLLGSEPRVELARVTGVTGFVSPPSRDAAAPAAERPPRTRRPFRAELAQVSGVDLEVRPKDGAAYDLEIDSAEVAPFRSRQALFDLLFRSNLQARVAGQPLRVETREITDHGRETRWRFEDVEADRLKLIVPKAPLTWLAGGRLNVSVEDSWSLSDDWIDMDWQVALSGVRVSVPEAAGTSEAMLAAGLQRLVALQGGSAAFGYRLKLDAEDVAAMRAGDLRAFWDVVLSGFLRREVAAAEAPVVDEEGADTPETPGRLRRALDRAKSVFGRDAEE